MKQKIVALDRTPHLDRPPNAISSVGFSPFQEEVDHSDLKFRTANDVTDPGSRVV
jgi:hypothetical protein